MPSGLFNRENKDPFALSPIEATIADVTNFLRGRDVMVAREVDKICRMASATPELSANLAVVFNSAGTSSLSEMSEDLQSSKNIAFMKVMMRPEFKEIRDRFDAGSKVMGQMVAAIGNNADFLKAQDHSKAGSSNLVFSLSPESGKLLLCDPAFADPLVTLSHLPPISEKKVKEFEIAVAKESELLTKPGKGYDAYKAEMTALEPAMNAALQNMLPSQKR